MKLVKKLLLFSVTMVLLAASVLPAYAYEFKGLPSINKHSTKPYYIEKYDVDIQVSENNTLYITESITAYFNEMRHGIYRNIPLSNRVERADGSTGRIYAKVTDVKVSESCSTYTENDEFVIQIGDEDETVIGLHSYRISYAYVMGKDIGDGFDELYYNIIGSGWDTYIDNVTFKITMPKEFDSSLLGFSTGSYGIAGTNDIEYYVNGNEISGSLTDELSPYEAFTIRLELPEGYFSFNFADYYAKLAAMVAIPLLALAIALFLWIKFGRDKKVVEVVEFYPPNGMSSLEVAYWYKGGLSTQDIIPLMIELANEGYIRIIEIPKKYRFQKNGNFMIERVRQYDGRDITKRIFYQGLFESGRGRSTVQKEDLENKFYKYLQEIQSVVNTSQNRKKVFESKSLIARIAGWAVSVAGAFISFCIYSEMLGGREKGIAFAIGMVIAVAAFIVSFFIRKRTEKGHEMLQKIKGFKLFLETAEKERLEALVYENPTYYYDILPYAYVLGVSDAWTRQFEGIAMEPPSWYAGNMFDRMIFWSFMNSTMTSATQAMSSSPQSSSSGGGGFSGGGSGGGGGGSW